MIAWLECSCARCWALCWCDLGLCPGTPRAEPSNAGGQVDAELARLAAEPELRKEYYALWDVQRKYAFWQADDEPPAAADAKPKARSVLGPRVFLV